MTIRVSGALTTACRMFVAGTYLQAVGYCFVLLVQLHIDDVKESKEDKGRVKYAGKHFIRITFYFLYVYMCVCVCVCVCMLHARTDRHTHTQGEGELVPTVFKWSGIQICKCVISLCC
jgi:Na+/melibiose symporter-like transporter